MKAISILSFPANQNHFVLDKIRRTNYSHPFLCSHCCAWASGGPKSTHSLMRQTKCSKMLHKSSVMWCAGVDVIVRSPQKVKNILKHYVSFKSKDAQYHWKEIAEHFHQKKGKISLTTKKLSNSCPPRSLTFLSMKAGSLKFVSKNSSFIANKEISNTCRNINSSIFQWDRPYGLKFLLEVKIER